MKYKVTVYCEGIIGLDVQCNKYLTIRADNKDQIDRKIEEQGWTVMEDNVLCDNKDCRIPNYKKE